MDVQERLRIVAEVIDNAKLEIMVKIAENKIPEDWDGVELRRYVVDYIEEHHTRRMPRERYHSYRNAVMVNGL